MHGFNRVTVLSPKVKVANPKANAEEIIRLIQENQDSNLLVFPELSVTGYTCADLFNQHALIEDAYARLQNIKYVVGMKLVFVGCPIKVGAALYNCAVAIHDKKIIGVVPKSFLPNYKEFYEARWFHPATGDEPKTVNIWGEVVPFGTDLIFEDYGGMKIFAEICEDIWMPIPPSSYAAIAGANVLVNLSASNETVAKADYRRDLVVNQSGRCMAAYLYASSGPSESTNDLVFGGHCLIAENGSLLVESDRVGDGKLNRESYSITTEIDVEKLESDRRQTTSFAFSKTHEFRRIYVNLERTSALKYRKVNGSPFIPRDKNTLDQRCSEISDIAVCGLAKRVEMLQSTTKWVIGVSGGLDSTLALLFAARTRKLLNQPTERILAYTMPGFGTTSATMVNAIALMKNLNIPYETVDIRPACIQMFKDLNHKPFGISPELPMEEFCQKLKQLPEDNREDLVFENVQARIRTSILMNSGFVIGTGDLSEAALGWCTYNGDHISMYNPNCSIPKSLVRFVVRYIADKSDKLLKNILYAIANTVISPELLPTNEAGEITQSTEAMVGAYELNDFFLFNVIRNGFSPEKIVFLAKYADFTGKYDIETIVNTLNRFYTRFFRNQFKRECVPNGPKVGSVSLSPRGDWRMPADASPDLWRL